MRATLSGRPCFPRLRRNSSCKVPTAAVARVVLYTLLMLGRRKQFLGVIQFGTCPCFLQKLLSRSDFLSVLSERSLGYSSCGEKQWQVTPAVCVSQSRLAYIHVGWLLASPCFAQSKVTSQSQATPVS